MNCFGLNFVKFLIEERNYKPITEFANVQFPEKGELIVNEYFGEGVRIFKDLNGDTNVLCPVEMDVFTESHITNAIANGTIFDDADNIDRHAQYIELCSLPYNGMMNKGKHPPKKMRLMLSCVVGKMDDCGKFEVKDTDVTNGHNFIKDVISHGNDNNKVKDIIDDYLGNQEHRRLPKKLDDDVWDLEKELESLNDVSNEDVITDDDFEFLDMGDEDKKDNNFEESFISRRPKKLKPIPIRDIVSYITVEMNAIQDSNDQAMLSGYTCAKLELVDFYLNVIDTQDARYIVPHDRQYLVNGQRDLNNLLTQILRIRPINRNDRVWRVNVNYPEGWRG